MKRAAVIIGVGQSGQLPVLQAAHKSAWAMKDWADAQGIDVVRVFTDEKGPLGPEPIKETVYELVDMANVEQLILYFSGHGINRITDEYWLLSNAPREREAAVNVSGSMASAGFSSIPHVVFISDACRTAPETIEASGVEGTNLFPNEYRAGKEAKIDVFYACTLGHPAYEIRDAEEAAAGYSSLYTKALLCALHGEVPKIIVPEDPSQRDLKLAGKEFYGLIRPWKLSEHLDRSMSFGHRKIMTTVDGLPIFQVPDSRIRSDPDKAWLSRICSPGWKENISSLAPPEGPSGHIVENQRHREEAEDTVERLREEAESIVERLREAEANLERLRGQHKQESVETAAAPGFERNPVRPKKRFRKAKARNIKLRQEGPNGSRGATYYSVRRNFGSPGATSTEDMVLNTSLQDLLSPSIGSLLRNGLLNTPRDSRVRSDLGPSGADFLAFSHSVSKPFGPMNFESRCGFKIRGSKCVNAFSRIYRTEIIEPDLEIVDHLEKGHMVRVWTSGDQRTDIPHHSPASVLLTFKEGTSALLPAIPNFLATLTIEKGVLTDVSYEPSSESDKWRAYGDRVGDLRRFRGVLSASANFGVLKLEGDDAAAALATRIQVTEGLDPTMSLYAAYAFHDQGNRDRIREIHSTLLQDLHFSFFDVAMLAGKMSPRQPVPDCGQPEPLIFPATPLLSSGWALLTAFGIQLPASLQRLNEHIILSPWTLFDPQGSEIIREALKAGGLS